jgi:hypothetical protein
MNTVQQDFGVDSSLDFNQYLASFDGSSGISSSRLPSANELVSSGAEEHVEQPVIELENRMYECLQCKKRFSKKYKLT